MIPDHLNHLKRIIANIMVDLITDTLNLRKNSFNPDAPLRWRPGLNTGIEFNTRAITPWNTLSDAALDSQLFHELTHEQGTDDGEAKDDWNDAHEIDNLMDTNLDKWLPLRMNKLKAKCKC